MAFIGKLEAASMSQHVRVDRENQLGREAGASEELARIARRHRPATLRDEEVG